MDSSTPPTRTTSTWLVRIPTIFEPVADEVVKGFSATTQKILGRDYYLIKTGNPASIRNSAASRFAMWNLPIHHAWPCNPSKMEDFVEKASKTLAEKFSDWNPQGIYVSPLNRDSPDNYFKKLASNLRGRALQFFPEEAATPIEEQDPSAPSLFCFVGREGLYCGMSTPREANGAYPGGNRFTDRNSAKTISRAGAKIAEALDHLQLYRPAPVEGSHWLELGACPGGMTSELLSRKQKVTAVDRAPLDPQLNRRTALRFVKADVSEFTPFDGTVFDAILTDMNGEPQESMAQVIRFTPWLRKHGLVIFTLKVPRVENLSAPNALIGELLATASEAGLEKIAVSHLAANRHEFTLFLRNERSSAQTPSVIPSESGQRGR